MITTITNQKIAVIGTGISGLTAANLLSRQHQVTVFEANDYIGGHTHTVPVELHGETYWIDTGFIVCNDWNYPRFFRLMEKLGVDMQHTEMSFSVRNDELNLEYNGHNLNTLFAQRRNLLRPKFYGFILDFLKFNKAAKALLASDEESELTLNVFNDQLNLGNLFKENYLLPMVAAIWSCSVKQAGEFPMKFFLKFFYNHGLLNVFDRPQWQVIKGGSHCYIEPLIEPVKDRIHLNTPVKRVTRKDKKIELVTATATHQFDHVVFACHSDQALALLAEPTEQESEILGGLQYQDNDVILHSDVSLMPKRKKAWASWNFLAAKPDEDVAPRVTYCMNILQNLECPEPMLVSLNAADRIDPAKIIQRFVYAHPVYSSQTVAAQTRRNEICGINGIHYCGAYWYNGFHEDGLRSALDVCGRFGEVL